MNNAIPIFDLYGEAQAVSALNMVHVERIHVRAHVNAWTILAHRHARLAQLFLITKGGGTVGIDAADHTFAAPCLIWLPALVVHGFRFLPQTDGIVLTAALDACRSAMAQGSDVATALHSPFLAAGIDVATREALERHFSAIEAERLGSALGGHAFRLHHLGLALIHAARHSNPGTASGGRSQAAVLVERFTSEVEDGFRDHLNIPVYAHRLGVSADRLHAACVAIAGRPPSALLHERIIVEARRALIYTSMSVSEIAFDLGFDDAAYFSRFFRQRTGLSPSALRRRAQTADILPVAAAHGTSSGKQRTIQ